MVSTTFEEVTQYKKGFDMGYDQGYEVGYDQGYAEGKAIGKTIVSENEFDDWENDGWLDDPYCCDEACKGCPYCEENDVEEELEPFYLVNAEHFRAFNEINIELTHLTVELFNLGIDLSEKEKIYNHIDEIREAVNDLKKAVVLNEIEEEYHHELFRKGF